MICEHLWGYDDGGPSSYRRAARRHGMAAGLGTRMRPYNGQIPKPLVTVGGKALIDHVLDRLAQAGVRRAVVNVHHLADQIERHLKGRKAPEIVISDERAQLLGTAGGPVNAMPQLGRGPFFLVNSDTIWIDGVMPNLKRLAAGSTPRAGRTAADGADRDRHRLFRPRRFHDGPGRAAHAPCRARRGAVRLCRRRDPHACVLCRRGPGPSSMSPLFDRAGKPDGCTACASTASGCMSARPRPWPLPKPRWSRARRKRLRQLPPKR